MSKKSSNSLKDNDAELYQKVLEQYFASHYINRRKLYRDNFFRGIAFGFGSFLAATIGVLLFLWILSLFENLPLVGRVAEVIRNSIKSFQ